MTALLAAVRGYWASHWHAVAVGIAGLAIVLAVVAHCGPKPPALPPDTTRALDSLRITQTAYDSGQRVAHDAIARAVAVAAGKAQEARAAQAAAAHYAHAKDSLAALLAAIPPVTHRDTVADLALAQADSTIHAQAAAIAADSGVIVAQRAAIITLVADTVGLSRRLAAQERATALVTAAFAKATTCKIIGLISCPSRSQAYVYGAITAAVGYVAVRVAKP